MNVKRIIAFFVLILIFLPQTSFGSTTVIKLSNSDRKPTTKSLKKTVKKPTKAEINRAIKIHKLEKIFSDSVMKHGLDFSITVITSDGLMDNYNSDIINTAKKLNNLSALINVAEHSNNPKIKRAAFAAEPVMIKNQKYYFSYWRQKYLNNLNKNRSLNDNYVYPNRCSNGVFDCDLLEIDDYCNANMTQDAQLLSYTNLYKSDWDTLRFSNITINFQDFITPPCTGFTKYYDTKSNSDDLLSPISIYGL